MLVVTAHTNYSCDDFIGPQLDAKLRVLWTDATFVKCRKEHLQMLDYIDRYMCRPYRGSQ